MSGRTLAVGAVFAAALAGGTVLGQGKGSAELVVSQVPQWEAYLPFGSEHLSVATRVCSADGTPLEITGVTATSLVNTPITEWIVVERPQEDGYGIDRVPLDHWRGSAVDQVTLGCEDTPNQQQVAWTIRPNDPARIAGFAEVKIHWRTANGEEGVATSPWAVTLCPETGIEEDDPWEAAMEACHQDEARSGLGREALPLQDS